MPRSKKCRLYIKPTTEEEYAERNRLGWKMLKDIMICNHHDDRVTEMRDAVGGPDEVIKFIGCNGYYMQSEPLTNSRLKVEMALLYPVQLLKFLTNREYRRPSLYKTLIEKFPFLKEFQEKWPKMVCHKCLASKQSALITVQEENERVAFVVSQECIASVVPNDQDGNNLHKM